MKKLLALLAFTILTGFNGCASTGTIQNPAQAVYAIQGDYAAALTIAVTYKNLPACEAPAAPVICSRIDVVQKLQATDNVAFGALSTAQNIVRLSNGNQTATQQAINAASEAVKGMTALVTTLRVK